MDVIIMNRDKENVCWRTFYDANSALSSIPTHLNGMYSVFAWMTCSSCTLTIYSKKSTGQINGSPETTSLK
jgi:hypothetical protein